MKKQIPAALWNPWFLNWQETGKIKCFFCSQQIFSGWSRTATWKKTNWSIEGKNAYCCWMCMHKKCKGRKKLFIERVEDGCQQIEESQEIDDIEARPRPKRTALVRGNMICPAHVPCKKDSTGRAGNDAFARAADSHAHAACLSPASRVPWPCGFPAPAVQEHHARRVPLRAVYTFRRGALPPFPPSQPPASPPASPLHP